MYNYIYAKHPSRSLKFPNYYNFFLGDIKEPWTEPMGQGVYNILTQANHFGKASILHALSRVKTDPIIQKIILGDYMNLYQSAKDTATANGDSKQLAQVDKAIQQLKQQFELQPS